VFASLHNVEADIRSDGLAAFISPIPVCCFFPVEIYSRWLLSQIESQAAQIAVSLQEDFLGYVLGITEISQLGASKCIYASLVFAYKHAKSL
jgi:hypothetical protein